MMRAIKRFVRNKRGSVAIEFALVGGFLTMATVPVVDISRLAMLQMKTNYGVEAATLYAARSGFNADAISQVVQSATDSTDVVASPSPYMFCGCPTSAGVTETSRTQTASSCGSGTCTAGGTTTPQGAYVKVQARASFSPLFNLPYPKQLNAAAVVRVK